MSLSDDDRFVLWLAEICGVSVESSYGLHYVNYACNEYGQPVRPEHEAYWERLAKILDAPEAEGLRWETQVPESPP